METAASYVKDTELRLGLPGSEAPEKPAMRGGKRALPEDETAFCKSSPEDDSGRRSVGAAPVAK